MIRSVEIKNKLEPVNKVFSTGSALSTTPMPQRMFPFLRCKNSPMRKIIIPMSWEEPKNAVFTNFLEKPIAGMTLNVISRPMEIRIPRIPSAERMIDAMGAFAFLTTGFSMCEFSSFFFCSKYTLFLQCCQVKIRMEQSMLFGITSEVKLRLNIKKDVLKLWYICGRIYIRPKCRFFCVSNGERGIYT